MYNRYIRRDDGTYTKVAEPEPPRQETTGPGPGAGFIGIV